ncbi:hypothetical protein [Cellulomonas sp. KRMCY2]|uniref:hypothetical protein n=1 Tax=Cellulomonas sp. KRMCY2 TaxID=1304865 RepID=UPI00045EAE45|nr:hypothetical protein [Cellulomonas sp. KRMCY2]
MKGHLKHMVIGGAGILVVLLLFGVGFQEALPWALLLACPLMMVGMMFMMNRNHGAGASGEHQHSAHCAQNSIQTPSSADRDVQAAGPEGRIHV